MSAGVGDLFGEQQPLQRHASQTAASAGSKGRRISVAANLMGYDTLPPGIRILVRSFPVKLHTGSIHKELQTHGVDAVARYLRIEAARELKLWRLENEALARG